jgi:DNA-binding response OmpR family regulator
MVYLAIENSVTVHERESLFWSSHGISSIRVSTMQEGIEKASKTNFYYIGINADNTNYMPLLSLLREVTHAPILISTSNYSREEHKRASRNGADLYGEISENPNDNYEAVTACINNLSARVNQRKMPVIIRAFSDIFIAPAYHRALIINTEIKLTKNEMDILDYFMANPGAVLSHGQIYSEVYDGELDENRSHNIYSALKRLRKKMKVVTDFDYIETVIDIGYRIIARK